MNDPAAESGVFDEDGNPCTAEGEQVREAREAGLPYCPQCGDCAHEPGDCQCQNMALGRCLCPDPGFELGLPSYLTRRNGMQS